MERVDLAAAPSGRGRQPRPGVVSQRPVGRAGRHARPRRPGHRAHGGPAPPPRHVGGGGAERRGAPPGRREAAPSRSRWTATQYRVRYVAPIRRRLPQVLQHRRQPDAVVHPALPLGPRPAPGHPRRRDGRLAQRLPGRATRCSPRPWSTRCAGSATGAGAAARPATGATRWCCCTTTSSTASPRSCGPPARRVPAPVRPHPLAAERRLARAARSTSARPCSAACSATTSSPSTRGTTCATSCAAAPTCSTSRSTRRAASCSYEGREVWVRAYPVSIDPASLRDAAGSRRGAHGRAQAARPAAGVPAAARRPPRPQQEHHPRVRRASTASSSCTPSSRTGSRSWPCCSRRARTWRST